MTRPLTSWVALRRTVSHSELAAHEQHRQLTQSAQSLKQRHCQLPKKVILLVTLDHRLELHLVSEQNQGNFQVISQKDDSVHLSHT